MTFEQQTAVFEAACKRHADKIEGMALNSAQREAYALGLADGVEFLLTGT